MKRDYPKIGPKYLILLYLSILAVMSFNSCGKKQGNQAMHLKGLIKTAKVIRMDFRQTVGGYGYVRALKKVDIVSYTQGRVTNIWVRNGDKVTKGERLLSIEGYYKIKEEESSPPQKEGPENPTRNIVRISPISGYVSLNTKNIGSAVQPGEILASIVDLEKVLVDIEVFGRDVELIKIGQAAEISSDGRNFKAKVLSVSATIDPQTGGRKVRIQISQEGPKRLLPGDFVKALVITSYHPSSLAIPAKAVLNDNGETVVMVKRGKTYEKRHIVTGLQNEGYVEVTGGLSVGEEVVTKGAYEILHRNIGKKFKVED